MKRYKGVPIFEHKILCDRKQPMDLQGVIFGAEPGFAFFPIRGPHRKYLYACESPTYGQALSTVSPQDALKMFKILVDRKVLK